MIRPATPADAPALAALYNPFVQHTTITFEEEPVSDAEMARRITEVAGTLPWLLEEVDGQLLGYAYASPWKARSAYRCTAETTVYVSPDAARRGVGGRLYRRLLEELKRRGFHSAIGLIALPNDPSIALHEKLGFVKVAHLHEVGLKFGRWIDVG
ncbi:MAG TPA: arsinothricin resistance N-acetyltransferase ArsN1 family B, partial [Holophagaceae bacterium]|nr:arsinothricin resistance N-acetyltransferase ArsN1 family B [Holophagaceae bacterium]